MDSKPDMELAALQEAYEKLQAENEQLKLLVGQQLVLQDETVGTPTSPTNAAVANKPSVKPATAPNGAAHFEKQLNFRTLINRIHEGVLYVDNDDSIIFANDSFCEMMGYTLPELIGKKAHEIFFSDPKQAPDIGQIISERKKGISGTFHLTLKNKQGQPLIIEVNGSPITDDDGNVIGSIGIHKDVTEQLNIVREKKQSEIRYEALVERMNEGLVTVGRNGKIRFVNKAFCKLVGKKREQLVGFSLSETLNLQSHTVDEIKQKLVERLAGKSEVYELSVKRDSGKLIWLNVSASPLYDSNNQIIGSMAIYMDISPQKKAVEENQRLQALVDATIDLVAVSDHKGKTLYLNNACRKTLSIPYTTPLSNIRWNDFYSPNVLAKLRNEIIPHVVQHGIWKGEIALRNTKGVDVPVSYVMICKKDHAGHIDFFASIARDISEVKLAQREIAILARMPEETSSPMLRVDREGVVVYANIASAPLLKEWNTAPGQKMPPIWLNIIQKVLSKGQNKEYEIDCGRKIFELKLSPVTEYDYVNIIGNDITQKKKSEKLLIASEKKYRAVVEDQTELISRFLSDGTVTFANNAYCRYYGLQQEELIGKKLFSFLPAAARKVFQKRLATLTKDSPVVTYSQEIKKNGVPIKWQMWTDRAIFDDNGIFIEYQSVGRDITELKSAEIEIRKKELYLRQIIDTIPSLIYVKGSNGHYQMGNKAFAEFVGAKVTNIHHLNDKDMFEAARAQQYMEADSKILNEEVTQTVVEEATFDEATGKTLWFQTIKTPLVVPGMPERQVLGISLDITELKEFENTLRFQLEFKELIASISTRFVNISYEKIDDAIDDALKELGTFLDVDRLTLLMTDEEAFRYRFAWLSQYNKAQDIEAPVDLSQMKWEVEQIKNHGMLYYEDLTQLPKQAKFLKQRMEILGLKSVLMLPIQSRNRMYGYFSVSNIRQQRQWNNYSIALLKIVSQIFSGALERKLREEVLNFRIGLENIITSISASFINISPQQIDSEIKTSLQQIAEFLRVDQGFVYVGVNDNKQFQLSHNWFSGQVQPVHLAYTSVATKDFLGVYKYMRTKGILAVPKVSKLPSEAAGLKDLIAKLKIRSAILIPIMYRGGFAGLFGFASRERESFWPEEAVPLLKILGQVLSNALERKATDENLAETKELYRTLAVNIPKSAVLLFDRNLRYRLVEGAALEEQGYSKEHIEGRTIYDVLPPTRRRSLEPVYKAALEGKETIFEREFNKKHYLIHILPVKSDSGEIYAGMVMSLDISDLKEIQKKLESQTAELIRSNEDLEQFAYAASHDLQEPLRMISSYVHLIQRKLQASLDGETKEFMNFAIDGVKRMQQLINDMLEYSRVDRKGNAFQEIDLNRIIELVKINLKNVVEETGAIVEFKDLPTINADQPQIISLFQNLMENALKFKGKDTPHITITSKEYKHKYRFSVKDNGIGIENKYFDRIFIIFQRLNSRKDYPGTGIGLAICKKIVERHGGRIWLRSTPGRGTKFYFEIAK